MRRALVTALLMGAVALVGGCSSSDGTSGAAGGPGWTKLSPAELDEVLADGDIQLVNVHVPYEGEIPGTDAHISFEEITSRLDELPEDPSHLVIYCRSGTMSTEAAQDMVADGYEGFAELEGGYLAWLDEGRPFIRPD